MSRLLEKTRTLLKMLNVLDRTIPFLYDSTCSSERIFVGKLPEISPKTIQLRKKCHNSSPVIYFCRAIALIHAITTEILLPEILSKAALRHFQDPDPIRKAACRE